MANELLVMPRKHNQPIKGDKMQMHGEHVRSGADNRVDVGNSDTYTATDGVEYVELFAASALWFRISDSGANAEVGKDEFLAAGASTERGIKFGQQIKCVANS